VDSNKLKQILGNILVAVPFTVIVFHSLSIILTEQWITFGSIVLGYLVSDYSIRIVANAEKGAGKIPFLSHLFQPKGLVYIFYIIGIIISTFLGTQAQKYIKSNGSTITDANLFIINLFLAVGIWLHFEYRYYNNTPLEAAFNSVNN
jgi:hypothetical protein